MSHSVALPLVLSIGVVFLGWTYTVRRRGNLRPVLFGQSRWTPAVGLLAGTVLLFLSVVLTEALPDSVELIGVGGLLWLTSAYIAAVDAGVLTSWAGNVLPIYFLLHESYRCESIPGPAVAMCSLPPSPLVVASQAAGVAAVVTVCGFLSGRAAVRLRREIPTGGPEGT